MRSGEVVHLADASTPLPPDLVDSDSFGPGTVSTEVEAVDSGNYRTHLVWHVVNSHETPTPLRYARFEILLSGDFDDCWAAILTITRR